MRVYLRLPSVAAILIPIAMTACAGSSVPSPEQSVVLTQTYPLSAGIDRLPDSNGTACTMTVPPNNAGAGGSITVTMPPPGTQPVVAVIGIVGAGLQTYYSTTYPNPAQIVATTNVAVVFQGAPSTTCAPVGSTSAPVGFVDPSAPGSIYGATIVVTTGSGGVPVVAVPAGASFPIGTL